MAKYVNSPLLSALTEGQDRSSLKLHSGKESSKQYSAASSSTSVEFPVPTTSSNSKLFPVKKNKRVLKGNIHNLRSTSLTSSRTELKRQISSTEVAVLDSNNKKPRLSALNENSTAQSILITDCIAHRTRSKTLLLQKRSITVEPIPVKKESPKVQLPQDISFIGSNKSAAKNTKNSLLNYYRETRNINRNQPKKEEISASTPNTSSIPKIKPSLKKKSSYFTKNNSANKSNNTFNINFDQKKIKKVRQTNRSNKHYTNPLPTSSTTEKTQNSSRKFTETPFNSRRSQLIKSSAIENNLEETGDKTRVPSDVKNYNLMAQQLSRTSTDIGGGQTTSGGSNGSDKNTTASTSTPGTAPGDSESDDSEVGRLQALLEARGLPPHLFGALGPRMTHILHRTIGNSSSSKAQQLLQGLQSNDESQQLQAVIEMCQMLVMGNEDTLAGFPIKQVVPALITLLRMEHNFDIMNNACRALSYMLEALPRSSGTVVDAVPVFLEKLKVIQCMDVAEQSLTALEILSRRHNKVILQAGGVAACLKFLDFFSMNAQRAALSTTANCCLNLHAEEFHFISESMPLLAQLLSQLDKKCVDSVCTAFSRLVESFQHDSSSLEEIASGDLLKNCQLLLVMSPSILNTGTFTSVIRMLSLMCSSCPNLAIVLLKNDIASTILYLLTGSAQIIPSNDVELVPRSPPELFEITCLIGELMPRLPTDEIFAVNALVDRPLLNTQDEVQWQWRDDRGTWHSYSPADSRIIDSAHMNSDDEITLNTHGRNYTVDFHSMQQINDETGTTRPVQRKLNQNYVPTSSPSSSLLIGQDLSTSGPLTQTNDFNQTAYGSVLAIQNENASINAQYEECGLESKFIKNLFNVLYEVYSSSAGPNVRYKCLRAILRMVHYASPDLLKDILKKQLVSSHIAGMMASNDLRIVVGALQMSEILMRKLPDVFGIHFRREGVLHQINQLAHPNNPIYKGSPSVLPSSSSKVVTQTTTSSASQENLFSMESNNSAAPSTSRSHGSRYKNSLNISNLQNATKGTSAGSEHYHVNNSHYFNPPQEGLASSLSVNENCFVYSTPTSYACHYNHQQQQQPPEHASRSHFQSHRNTDILPTSVSSNTYNTFLEEPSTNSTQLSSSASVSFAIQSKVSDILKRNVPPKRKSQPSNRSKSKQDDSIVQDLINRATGTGSSNSSSRFTASANHETTRSRFGGGTTSSGTSSKSSFLSSLNPARWGRQGSHNTSLVKDSSTPNCISGNVNKNVSHVNQMAAVNREKARQWIREQAISFVKRYTEEEISKSIISGSIILCRLSVVITNLEGSFSQCLEALQELKVILMENDISPFEVNHSGLIKSMLHFMAVENDVVSRDRRLRAFLHVFAGLPLESSISCTVMPNMEPSAFSAFVAKLNGCVTQLEQFPVKVHDFPSGTGGHSNISALKFFNTHQLKCNLQRHPDCNNLRQWKGGTVKIDPLAMVQAIERYLVSRGYGGIREESDDDSEEDMDDNVAGIVMSHSVFKHKLQFLIGDNILPYAMTVYQAVKQYSPLINEQSETDTEPEIYLENANIWAQQHTIYYRLLEDQSLANDWCGSNNDSLKASTTSKSASGSLSKKGISKSSSKLIKKKTDLWLDGVAPEMLSPLKPFLLKELPTEIVSVQDASIDALCMLRIVHALNRNWESLYDCAVRQNIISQSEFIHTKLTAKANRQLQDPLVIMTGNLPQWLQQIPMACPFLFPFETRHLLFYAVSFDRDRALQRLLDTTPDLNSVESSERVAPRLDRRKRTIAREEILKQAEHIIQDSGHSKALLEIQYENEVGTGLGPTLEFYALVSAELQRTELGLWNGNNSYKPTSYSLADVVKSRSTHKESYKQKLTSPNDDVSLRVKTRSEDNTSRHVSSSIHVENNTSVNSIALNIVELGQQQNTEDESFVRTEIDKAPANVPSYVDAIHGLFPMPLGKSSKLAYVSKVKSKFKFLGKLMAKAVMDSRMLDLAFSTPFYRWLLGEEQSTGLIDLARVAPEVQKTLVRLKEVVKERDMIKQDSNIDSVSKAEKIEMLSLDGCLISDLGLDFVLPGHANIELRRGGRDIPVTIHNLHNYISLVSYWFLFEGVQKQFEALREGFDMVFPCHRLKVFYPEELENVFCGSGNPNYQPWDLKMLQECCRTDHGFSQDSQAIQFLFDILASYNSEEQRLFLQFVTGSPRLPTGGFKSLTPPLTIVRKTLDTDQNPNDYLPSVMTCVNYLKLPEYSSYEVMRTKLKIASTEGSMSFHLS
ncbi:E3 ubiquitin-protein ligase TRIP12 isoform X2 [Episyrphus balteatus]|uniref:E3 ubiquitin-protein ligase TRIP12 isoform X2 n=1 Tax=Episyrphus balteatus TaxID=286459 RepID=UPI00248622B3|nr:E3 ubiquitin-protein ligase TRIP12 isoform X2 [Episyrphus balteatus]